MSEDLVDGRAEAKYAPHFGASHEVGIVSVPAMTGAELLEKYLWREELARIATLETRLRQEAARQAKTNNSNSNTGSSINIEATLQVVNSWRAAVHRRKFDVVIDAQGAGYEVLRSFDGRATFDRIETLRVEVESEPVYDGQSLLWDVDDLLVQEMGMHLRHSDLVLGGEDAAGGDLAKTIMLEQSDYEPFSSSTTSVGLLRDPDTGEARADLCCSGDVLYTH
ncbi:unnamed protein product [Amoebophrya sp. A25]|nr:unnamed protein product [Amoebophrya sp. A25]|eukprot:GSA25T00025817001.1